MSLLQNIVSFVGLFCKETYNFKEPAHDSHPILFKESVRLWSGYDFDTPSNYSSPLQNMVSFIGLFCKRDLSF